jgi:hypothetical protein
VLAIPYFITVVILAIVMALQLRREKGQKSSLR